MTPQVKLAHYYSLSQTPNDDPSECHLKHNTSPDARLQSSVKTCASRGRCIWGSTIHYPCRCRDVLLSQADIYCTGPLIYISLRDLPFCLSSVK